MKYPPATVHGFIFRVFPGGPRSVAASRKASFPAVPAPSRRNQNIRPLR